MKTNSYSNYSANVNFIKFVAANMVILSHAFSLSTGNSVGEWFIILTGGQYSMGGIAVCIFFFYSGLLITRRLEKNSNAKEYFVNRSVRIIPSLAFVVFVSAFIMGPLVTTVSLSKYFADSATFLYLLNSLLIPVHNLPGVFEHNAYLPTVNGSLWTLPVEALCYVGCFLLFKMKLYKKFPMKILIGLSVLLDIIIFVLSKQIDFGMLYSCILPMLMFFAGIVYYIFRDSIKMDYKYFIVAGLVIVIANMAGILLLGLYLGFPYILAYLGFASKKISEKMGNLGKISYGIYLCAFPIQQCLVWGSGGTMNVYVNMVLAVPLAMVGGWFLYEFVEKGTQALSDKVMGK